MAISSDSSDDFPLKMVMFHIYVSLPEGKSPSNPIKPAVSDGFPLEMSHKCHNHRRCKWNCWGVGEVWHQPPTGKYCNET